MIGRLTRERKTVRAMMRIFCNAHHSGSNFPCPECEELLAYAMQRIDRCPYEEGKPTCANCPIHCYKAVMKERIQMVMRYAGPRMMIRHPLLALMHGIDSLIRVKPSLR